MKLPPSLTAPLALHGAQPRAGARSSAAKNRGGSVSVSPALTWTTYYIPANAEDCSWICSMGDPHSKLDAPYPSKDKAHYPFDSYALDLPSLGLYRR
ncbi:MAG: hypothetical protein K6T57_12740 [Thermaceae bacterium]|nr:hypothetical protein [Thermaceae bacterium]